MLKQLFLLCTVLPLQLYAMEECTALQVENTKPLIPSESQGDLYRGTAVPPTISMRDYETRIELERKIARNNTLKKTCCLASLYCGLNAAKDMYLITHSHNPMQFLRYNNIPQDASWDCVSNCVATGMNCMCGLTSLCFCLLSWDRERTAAQHLQWLIERITR